MHKIVQVGFFSLTGGAQISNPQVSWAVTMIGIWQARLSIHLHRAMSSPRVIKVSRNFSQGLYFIAENQIFFRNSFFSNIDSHRFLYWLIKWLLMNRMFNTTGESYL